VIYLVISGIYLMILAARFDREFGANQWANPGGEGSFVEARGAVNAVQVEQRQRRVAKRRGSLGERFGEGRPTEE